MSTLIFAFRTFVAGSSLAEGTDFFFATFAAVAGFLEAEGGVALGGGPPD
jgi:hypothetical protein